VLPYKANCAQNKRSLVSSRGEAKFIAKWGASALVSLLREVIPLNFRPPATL